jgi:hypothetical protein
MEAKIVRNTQKIGARGLEAILCEWRVTRGKLGKFHDVVKTLMEDTSDCRADVNWVGLYQRAGRLERKVERTDSILGEELLFWEAGEDVWRAQYVEGSLIWQN